MRDDLLLYYERELRFIRKMAANFAEKYPDVAARLRLEPTKCEDPHVERMIEAFAMLSARVHLRLDDDFSEVSDSLLEILYPHYLRPIPSMTITQLALGEDGTARFKADVEVTPVAALGRAEAAQTITLSLDYESETTRKAVAIDIANVPLGSYLLRVTVTDLISGQGKSRSAPLELARAIPELD